MTKLRNLLAIHELNIKTLCSYERTAEMTNYSLDLYNLQMQKQKVKDIEKEILDLFQAPKSEEQALLNLSDFLATQIDKLNTLTIDIDEDEDDEEEEEEEQEMSAADKEEERGIAAFEDDRQSNWD